MKLLPPLTIPRCFAVVALFAFTALATSGRAADVPWEMPYGALLAKYATANGVRYSAWKTNAADLKALDDVTSQVAKTPVPADKNAKLAAYINAYNAWVLKKVLDAYPTKSVRDVAPLFGFFTRKDIEVGGDKTSLNALEKEVIRGIGEPRVHFALNCASTSCPLLAKVPYEGSKLDAQLDKGAKGYLNGNDYGLTVADGGKKLSVSKIFDWYKDDFKAMGGTIGVVNKYRKEQVPADASVSIMEYNWSLNEAK